MPRRADEARPAQVGSRAGRARRDRRPSHQPQAQGAGARGRASRDLGVSHRRPGGDAPAALARERRTLDVAVGLDPQHVATRLLRRREAERPGRTTPEQRSPSRRSVRACETARTAKRPPGAVMTRSRPSARNRILTVREPDLDPRFPARSRASRRSVQHRPAGAARHRPSRTSPSSPTGACRDGAARCRRRRARPRRADAVADLGAVGATVAVGRDDGRPGRGLRRAAGSCRRGSGSASRSRRCRSRWTRGRYALVDDAAVVVAAVPRVRGERASLRAVAASPGRRRRRPRSRR